MPDRLAVPLTNVDSDTTANSYHRAKIMRRIFQRKLHAEYANSRSKISTLYQTRPGMTGLEPPQPVLARRRYPESTRKIDARAQYVPIHKKYEIGRASCRE